jgi:hypothetical protein
MSNVQARRFVARSARHAAQLTEVADPSQHTQLPRNGGVLRGKATAHIRACVGF